VIDDLIIKFKQLFACVAILAAAIIENDTHQLLSDLYGIYSDLFSFYFRFYSPPYKH